jgi:hypothetical protein
MINLMIEIAVAVIIFLLIFKYLIPLLPAPFGTIMLIVLVVAAIIWLIRLARTLPARLK